MAVPVSSLFSATISNGFSVSKLVTVEGTRMTASGVTVPEVTIPEVTVPEVTAPEVTGSSGISFGAEVG